jgi:hypothetical protein
MHHLSFGRKEGRGLGNKNTIFRVIVRVVDGSFFDGTTGFGGWRFQVQAAPPPMVVSCGPGPCAAAAVLGATCIVDLFHARETPAPA